MAFVKSCATLRGLAVAIALAVALALAVRFVATTPYHDVTGFLPFDLQSNLSHVMVGIELGTVVKGTARDAYLLFAAFDVLSAAATAWAFMLAWVWVFAAVPNRLFAMLSRGGIHMVPFYVLTLDLAAKAGFFRLVSGLEGDDYADAIDFSVIAHRVAFAMMDVRNYLTVAFILAALTGLILRRVRK
jgi:hypothetical protein